MSSVARRFTKTAAAYLQANGSSAVGGRVLNVTALGRTVTAARDHAYETVDRIDWPEGFCRRDIGWRAVERERA